MSELTEPAINMEKLVALCKRRGFINQASEIYGGIKGFWDYGPLGTELKNNIRDLWWQHMVHAPPIGPDGNPVHIVGLDSSIIQHPTTWESSGHLGGFSDPMVDCRESKKRYRADHVMVFVPKADAEHDRMYAFMEGDPAPAHKKMKKSKVNPEDYETICYTEIAESDYPKVLGPDAKEDGTLTAPREFNLMFKTFVGAASGEDNVAYLRPETAQGIFLNYRFVVDTMRVKMPFGVAQIGKSFRNEVTPRNYIFRSREFEQMEMEWFCPPDQAKQWLEFWKEQRMAWWRSLGITSDRLIFRDHDADELAHYSKDGYGTVDIEYKYPFTAPGYGELEGIAHRGDFDLNAHEEASRTKMVYIDPVTNKRYIPHVIEPASGLTRGVLVVLCEAFCEEWIPKGGGDILPVQADDPDKKEGYEKRSVLKFDPKIAPIKVAVFPLQKNDEKLVGCARDVFINLRTKFHTMWDAAGNIGKRYRRQDEIGTPFCVTVDFDSLEDGCVTLRDRDTMVQERVKIDELESILASRLV